MKNYILKLSFSLCLMFAIGTSVSHTDVNCNAGWGIAAAIAYTAGADDDTANMAGNIGGAGVGAAAGYAGAEAGAAIGSVGGPLGALVGGALGFL